MARKWLTPVSIIVFILGIAMVVWSLTRSGDSTSSTSAESSSTSAVEVDSESSSTAIAEDPTPTSESSTVVTASSSSITPATTTAPRAPSTPTTVVPSVTVRPMTPGGGSIAPTTVAPPTAAPLSIPPVAVTPAIVEPPACSSYADCAQKLFNAWQSSDRDAKTQALNFGTREAVNALFYVRSIGFTWDPTVRRSTALKYVATGTVTATGWEDRGSKSIEFVFTRGQSGYKVQSVEFF